MAITDDNKEKLKARLSQAIEHSNHVYRMVDDKKYCVDILNELKAVQAELDRTADVILRQHIETCVVEAVQRQDAARVIEELMLVFRQSPSLYGGDQNIELMPFKTLPVSKKAGGCC